MTRRPKAHVAARWIALATILLLSSAASGVAHAHWCDDLWGSSYNISVRPATDTVSVPASGEATLDVWVQNNMGYPLKNFAFDATLSSDFEIAVSRQTPTVEGYLMPGERLRYSLQISSTSGGIVTVEEIEMYVSFGDGGQSGQYGRAGRDVMIRKVDGTLYPAEAPGLGEGNSQALHLQYAAAADYGDVDAALDGLLQEYCAGRSSWDHSNTGVIATHCADTSSTSCPGRNVDTGTTKWDWQKLWSIHDLAYRKAALGARAATLRERLQCGWDDPHLTFQAMAAFVLGYLGEDAGARAFLEGKISGGDSYQAGIAMAALLLMNSASDLTTYGDDVVANVSSPSFPVAQVSAAALGIINRDDDVVTSYLIPRAQWGCPGGCDGPGDDGEAFLAAHLLSLVAWDRRGWVPHSGDVGAVSFYNDEALPVPEGAPDCTSATVSPTSGEIPLSVTLDASGCTDPDGDAMTFAWRVATSITTDVTYDTASATHTFDEPGNFPVHLTVTDDADPPVQSSRDFLVVVYPEGGAPGVGDNGDCACAASASPRDKSALLAVVALGFFALRRRRRPHAQ